VRVSGFGFSLSLFSFSLSFRLPRVLSFYYRLAVEKTSTWLMVDAWESLQDEYQRTAVVLDHFDEEINGGSQGGVLTSDGSRRKIRVMLLAGGDLIQSMGEPGVWADADVSV
jgi:nicotinamide mononucleotide adenylyltransferase